MQRLLLEVDEFLQFFYSVFFFGGGLMTSLISSCNSYYSLDSC